MPKTPLKRTPRLWQAAKIILGAARPPRPLTANEWAERNREVPVGTSPEPGRWRSKVYQVDVLESASDPTVEGTLYVACSQGGGKTEILMNVAGYYAEHDPSPILLVEPNVEMANALSKDRISGMIRETPALRKLVHEARTRESGNTIRHKEFPGGHLTLVGANSAAGLAMRPIRVVLFDEIDRYPPSAGTEGDPIKLAEARTTAFWNAVKVTVTSPGYKEGRSYALWEKSDKREFFVPCGDCGTEQILKWSSVHWEKDEVGEPLPETALYVCEACGSTWNDATRYRAIRAGAYKATAKSASNWRGFRLPALAVLGRKLTPMVEQWLEAQGNPEQLKVFINTVLAEWWEEQYSTVDETGLLARREPLPMRSDRHTVPASAALITAGIDVQDNRLETSVYAWGSGEESWLLDHKVHFGDPAGSALWEDLDDYLMRPWEREAGGVDYIRGASLDTGGHHTDSGYKFCAPRFRRVTPDGGRSFVFAIKGTAGLGDLWPRAPSKNVKKVPLWPLRVDAGKDQLYGRLQLVEPGPGYCHFPDTVGLEFFLGLTAEKVETTTNRKGFPVRAWRLKKAGSRNEPLDCGVYAYAALCGLRAMGFDLQAEVDALESRPIFDAPKGESVSPPSPATKPRRRSGKWVEKRSDWLK